MDALINKQPTIVKYTQQVKNGIQSQVLSRHCIGYIVRGKKYIYNGDIRTEMSAGEMFYLNVGTHYVEDIPDGVRPFEQIVFYYSTDQLTKILTNLSIVYQLKIENDHVCHICKHQNFVVAPTWSTIRNFFGTVNQYLRDDIFATDVAAENMKITELMYHILSQKDSCLKSKVLSNADMLKENFEHIIHKNIFNVMPIEDLASMCNRSLTSFKKEFKRHFFEPPHKWFIKQRLMHSRLLLISTNKSISEIGAECSFPNTSHFIKLFKKVYMMTPATYRHKYGQDSSAPQASTKVRGYSEVVSAQGVL